jgi:signal transduction histidine kinase
MTADGMETEDAVATRLLRYSANRGEMIISCTRIAFCSLVLCRFLFFEAQLGAASSLWRTVLELPLLLLAISGSTLALLAARKGRFNELGLCASTLADATVCALALAPNVLWPLDNYRGLLRLPDVASTIAVLWLGVLRLSERAMIAGALGHVTLSIALIGVDCALNPAQVSYGANDITMLLVLLSASGVASCVAAARVRTLVKRAGRETARLGRAQRNLNSLLRDHHDVRTLLMSVQMNLEMAATAPVGGSQPQFSAAQRALAATVVSVKHIREQALTQITMLDGIAPSDLSSAIRTALVTAALRFPKISLGAAALEATSVQIVGGERGLAHLLLNALINACEGNGRETATRVDIAARVETREQVKWVEVTISDDGPGFSPQLFNMFPAAGATTKADGTGLGLALMRQLVQASAGQLHISNKSTGGAELRIYLLKTV